THSGGVQSHLTSSMSAAIAGPRFQVFGTGGAFVKYGVDMQEAQLRSGVRPEDAAYGAEDESDWGTWSDGETTKRIPTKQGDYSPFYAGVSSAILRGARPPVEIAEVAAGLEIIEAAFQSASTGKPVRAAPPER